MDARKRVGGEFTNGVFKKHKTEMDYLSSGIGSKSKPCTKFFSMAGCPYGENCHFLHFVPGGYKTVAQMLNLSNPSPTSKPVAASAPVPIQNGPSSTATLKTKLCSKYKTAEGCKYGDKCHFAHGEWELGKPITPSHEDHHPFNTFTARFAARPEPNPAAASFGTSATAKISVDASLAGGIIGKGGVNSKQISRQTGVRLSIRDHESDPSLKNIELEGSFEQIQQASVLVRELIASFGNSVGAAKTGGGGGAPGSNFKTRLCENFSKGSCTFGDRCHFAHGTSELRKTGI